MIWRDLYIAGTAAFLPPRTDITATPGSFRAALGYRSATIAAPGTGLQMAVRAALLARHRSGHEAAELSLLTLAATIPADTTFMTPVCHVQRILGADHARAVDLSAASTGDLAGLVAAAEHLSADPSTMAAMAVATSCLADVERQGSPDYVMSDGAAALVLSRRRSQARARLMATAHISAPQLEPITRLNLTSQQRAMAANNLPEPLLSTLRDKTMEAVRLVLDEADTSMEKLSRIVVHGAGLPFLSTVIAQPLDLDPADTTWPFHRNIGHAGPCDHFLGLDHLLHNDAAVEPGDLVLVVGMGAGWRWICVLVEILRTDRRADIVPALA
ncbi:3-oxoacyl-[acyl-carrier-protein] synthase III C-terminal domain-containing protein [Streptomyces albicerus]|uniref:3-oxoacyl-[acyl-carrier-protein] synthase III C-terminal domain-containing protein n=1 Tax=Streptomyces albicerus TaxID=2569859 RepID=UPI00124B20E1|nr:3-oxoacyl-[acyl-carrier-protein] synthase III C-terminal domain-containing protein [Streptomyces albicerus]